MNAHTYTRVCIDARGIGIRRRSVVNFYSFFGFLAFFFPSSLSFFLSFVCAFIETYTMPIRWEYWLTYRFSSGDSLISLKHRASGEILFGLDDGIDGRDGMEL